MHLYKVKSKSWIWGVLFAAVGIAVVCVFWYTSNRMEQTAKIEGAAMLKDAVNRGVVSCYAIEGRYPESLDYLEDNYGVQIDRDNYSITYEVFADNIRPQVSVTRRTNR